MNISQYIYTLEVNRSCLNRRWQWHEKIPSKGYENTKFGYHVWSSTKVLKFNRTDILMETVYDCTVTVTEKSFWSNASVIEECF